MELLAFSAQRCKPKFNNLLLGRDFNNDSYLRGCNYALTAIRASSSQAKDHFKKSEPLSARLYTTKKRSNSLREQSSVQLPSLQPNLKAKERVHVFEPIKVVILSAVERYEHIAEKVVYLNLERYFRSFYRNLNGYITVDFVELVESYMSEIVRDNNLDEPVDDQQLPVGLAKFTDRSSLVSYLQEIEGKGKREQIKLLLRKYCVPPKVYRESCLRDVLLLIANTIYEQFNKPKDLTYSLMTAQGSTVSDILLIPMTRTQLYLAATHPADEYRRLKSIIFDHEGNNMRRTFVETLQHTVREKVFKGTNRIGLDETTPRGYTQEQRIRLNVIEKKMGQQRKKSPKAATKVGSFSNESIGDIKSASLSEVLERVAPKPLSQYERRLIDQFKDLQVKSEILDITFNQKEQNKDKAYQEIVLQHSPYFTNKKPTQRQRMLKSLQIDCSSELLGLQDFIKINTVANCRCEPNMTMKFIGNYLTFDSYGLINRQGFKSDLLQMLGSDSTVIDVVLEVVWAWMERNGIVIGDYASRGRMEEDFRRTKMAYYVLVAMAFGTGHPTPMDMAYQILS